MSKKLGFSFPLQEVMGGYAGLYRVEGLLDTQEAMLDAELREQHQNNKDIGGPSGRTVAKNYSGGCPVMHTTSNSSKEHTNKLRGVTDY